MGALGTTIVAGLRRRRARSVAIASVLLLASAGASLALAILVQSTAPYERAFADANGAHLIITYVASTDAALLAESEQTQRVTAAAGPWPVSDLAIDNGPGKGGRTMTTLLRASGRAQPDPGVDRMTLTYGRWWSSPGELVLTSRLAHLLELDVGDTVRVGPLPTGDKRSREVGADGAPAGPDLSQFHQLTVVGIADFISTPATGGWLSPADIADAVPAALPDEQVLYRVAPADTAADLSAAAGSITASLPTGSLVETQTYLQQKESIDRTASLMVPILLAFSVFALFAAAFIVVNVVTGVVLAGYRDIGVLKAVGFTPSQVTTDLLGQIAIPAILGTLAGVLIGTFASLPVLQQASAALGLPPTSSISWPIVLAVVATALATVLVAACVPASRAGHLDAVSAITRGTAPSRRADGSLLRRRTMSLPVPDPVRLGLASGFARPLRALMTLGALVVGVAALVFAIGMDASLRRVALDLIRDQASPIRVEVGDRARSADDIGAAIAADPATDRWVAIGDRDVTVSGGLAPIPFVAYDGDSSWLGYALIHGRWMAGPGEAVAPTNFFTQTGHRIGDPVDISLDGRTVALTLVGEIFDQAREARDDVLLRGQWADLAMLDPTLVADRWEVLPKPGTDLATYRSDLTTASDYAAQVEIVQDSTTDEGFLLFEGVVALLGIVLVIVSLGGVFDTVLLETRARVREIAVLKAVGMTPRQVMTMVVSSVAVVGILGGIVGVPLGMWLQHVVLGVMGQAASGTDIPESVLDVFGPVSFVAMAASGLCLAIAGAWLPAQRAASARIVTVLQEQ